MSHPFADHFSRVARDYATHRPRYPEALFAWLAQLPARRELAWDCAAGNGQASVGLASFFSRVIATDASRAQVTAATPHPRIEYRVAPAETSGLESGSTDLVTVAQALHWIDLQTFYPEVARVLAPGGALAVWTYGLQRVEAGPIDELLQDFYTRVVGPYWAPERKLVETGYRTLPFPFQEVSPPDFAMEVDWTLPELLGYVGTWSATDRFRQVEGSDPVEALGAAIAKHWDDPGRSRRVRWPLSVRAGYGSR
jgi:ubiquinone/menaquinone biosynthesis C-methylase UbiE